MCPEGDGGAESDKKKKLPENKSQNDHIFRDEEGHLRDTPENRELLENTANNPNNYLGKDQYGNEWYAYNRADGSQVWVRTQGDIINNGGVNTTPRLWDPNTGLNKPLQ